MVETSLSFECYAFNRELLNLRLAQQTGIAVL